MVKRQGFQLGLGDLAGTFSPILSAGDGDGARLCRPHRRPRSANQKRIIIHGNSSPDACGFLWPAPHPPPDHYNGNIGRPTVTITVIIIAKTVIVVAEYCGTAVVRTARGQTTRYYASVCYTPRST